MRTAMASAYAKPGWEPIIYVAEGLTPNSNYTIHRKDRPDGYGRSLTLINENIIINPVEVNTPCDILFQKIECINKETLIIGSAYSPTNNDDHNTTELYNAICCICK